MRKFIYMIALVGVMASCNFSNSQYTNQLKNLDSQLEQNPEMVWDSLKKINPEHLSTSQQAYYYLLYASATDKNLVYLENDSTLRVALEYYREHNEPYNLARSQYYMGKYVQKRQQTKTAYDFFKQAELNYKKSKEKDPHLLGLIYYQLGLILKQQNSQEEAESFINNSYDLFMESKDTISAVHSLKLSGMLMVIAQKYEEAQKKLFESLNLVSEIKNYSEKVFQAKASTLLSISYFYNKIHNLEKALEFGKKSILLHTNEKKEIPSQYYCNILFTFYRMNNLDSTRIYCEKTITAAKKENNIINLSNGYRILSYIEEKEGNYKKACELKNYSNKQKDITNETINKNNILELERKYNKAEAQRLLLKAENNNLRAYAIITVIIFGSLIIGLPFYFRHKKLKLKYNKLSETIKHTEWGFLVTKEFITENHIAYDELERILNREKGLDNINSELYNKIHDALIQQKANYSGRLFDRLTNFDGNFGTKFQQLFPDFSTDELLMATMIHHKWRLTDMTTIFHVSIDAIRKRKARLAHKISIKLKKEIDLDDYLANL